MMQQTTQQGLRADGIVHRYGGAVALRDVNFDVNPGEVHALVGENGAGKSTLVKILTGAIVPTEGQLLIDGEPRILHSPREARRLGVGVVHQDYNLFPDLSVGMNVCGIGAPTDSHPFHNGSPSRINQATQKFFDEFGIDINPRTMAGELEAAERKIVEIARALIHRPLYLLLDEPTAALEPKETRRLLNVINDLRDRGTGLILVTHRLGEIAEVADRATALRDGRNVGSLTREELTPAAITRLMVGSDVEQLDGPSHPPTGERLGVHNVQLRDDTAPVDITVGGSEIVAVCGLVGSGCGALLGTVTGARPDKGARIVLDGREVKVTSPQVAARLGIGYAPEDRKKLGLIMGQSIRENMALTSLPRWTKFGFFSRKHLDKAVEENKERFDIRCRSASQAVETLSGGNQQKVLLARLQLANPKIIVLHEPSQGVDVAARHAIHEHMVDFAREGGSVLFSSTDIDEVRAVAHRIYILHGGEVTHEFDNVGPNKPDRPTITQAVSVDPRLEASR